MDFVNNGHYQLACTRYFELTHKGSTVDQAINHPNQYFEESQKVKSNLSTKTEDKSIVSSSKLTTVKSVMYPGVIKREMEEVDKMELTQDDMDALMKAAQETSGNCFL
ncbi:uncharacterized protein LOC111083337 [Limulus polyphemus]|uniref:Uncharacterized protein LOC111083337 n=1 Tax=Limulus polyphemus TaxID=6850 RepID=A0ABM1RVW1_LIMPO|nr:uncharacterized protein LOC111083337 [Limulus polyphemus]